MTYGCIAQVAIPTNWTRHRRPFAVVVVVVVIVVKRHERLEHESDDEFRIRDPLDSVPSPRIEYRYYLLEPESVDRREGFRRHPRPGCSHLGGEEWGCKAFDYSIHQRQDQEALTTEGDAKSRTGRRRHIQRSQVGLLDSSV